jgi:hypothetical protein
LLTATLAPPFFGSGTSAIIRLARLASRLDRRVN